MTVSNHLNPFLSIFNISDNRLFDAAAKLRQENLELKIDKKIRDSSGGTSGTDLNNAQIQALEKKVLAQQEELTDLHKRKGEHSQMVITLNQKLTELQRTLAEKEKALAEQTAMNVTMRDELEELKTSYITIKDESLAWQLNANSAEERLRGVQEENAKLLKLLMEYKSRDAEIMNKENDKFFREKKARIESELERAIKDIPGPSSLGGLGSDMDRFDFGSDGPPEGIEFKFDAHDGEVNAVRWSPVERVVATGGADRKVKLWDVGKGEFGKFLHQSTARSITIITILQVFVNPEVLWLVVTRASIQWNLIAPVR